MRLRTIGFLALLLTTSPIFAADAPPSDASVHELLQVMQAHKLVDSMMGQVKGMMQKSEQQNLAGSSVDAAEQKILDQQDSEVYEVMRQALSWESLEPVYIDMYKKSFSQKEVNDMVAFYKSPSGQAVVVKMPLLMQQGMQIMQKKIAVLMPDMQKIAQETTSKLAAYKASKDKAPAPSTNTSGKSDG